MEHKNQFYLQKISFKRCTSNQGVYLLRDEKNIQVFLALYVDDLLILSEDINYINNVKTFLNNEFDMTNFGEIELCLGIQVIRKRATKTINLGQRNYIENIFKFFGTKKCRPISTPLDISSRLCKSNEPMIVEKSKEMEGMPYREMIGCLMYAMIVILA